jgi:hypothetical protein
LTSFIFITRRNAFGNDSRAEQTRSGAIDLSIKKQLHMIRPTQVNVFADYLFKELTAMYGPV